MKMRNESKKVKCVAFQLADPMEFRMYHFALQHTQFSPYIKRLIQRDMENGSPVLNEDWETAFKEYNSVKEEVK